MSDKKVGIVLAQLSDSVTLTVNSESVEAEEVQDNSCLNSSLVIQKIEVLKPGKIELLKH